jgi:hypothetical protein
MGRIRNRIRNFFRRIGRFFRRLFEGIADFFTTVIGAVIVVIESIFGWVLSALAFVLDMIFSIPFLGRILRWIWNALVFVLWTGLGPIILGIIGIVAFLLGGPVLLVIVLLAFGAFGLLKVVDFLFALIGIRPEKKLRICTIILRDVNGVALETPANLVPELQQAIDTFRREASVRVVRLAPFEFDSGFAGPERATTDWVHVHPRPTIGPALNVRCEAAAGADDLGRTGGFFERVASTTCFYGNARRLLGYGAPVTIFVVQSVSGTDAGCSLGPLSDYVTVQATGRGLSTIAHELGHACNLWHVDSSTNLMFPGGVTAMNPNLRPWQAAILRNSARVTYF